MIFSFVFIQGCIFPLFQQVGILKFESSKGNFLKVPSQVRGGGFSCRTSIPQVFGESLCCVGHRVDPLPGHSFPLRCSSEPGKGKFLRGSCPPSGEAAVLSIVVKNMDSRARLPLLWASVSLYIKLE